MARLIEAARDTSPIAGFTHNFYRYPARFSPKLVRAAIDAFTEPGDLVLDPFVGGGTTLVEALVSGRHAVGADISSLATFVSEVKTTILSERELARLSRWVENAAEEPMLIDAMKNGDDMKVQAQSGRGTKTSYSFSLKGISAALDSIAGCK